MQTGIADGPQPPPHNTTNDKDLEIKYLQSCRSNCQTLQQVGNDCREHVYSEPNRERAFLRSDAPTYIICYNVIYRTSYTFLHFTYMTV